MASLDHRLNPLFSIKECMTCGALYTADFCCSKGGLEDKILVPKPPQNCPTCGKPVDGYNCRHCVFVRKCLNEGWYTIHDENEILNTSKSSNQNTNIVSAPQEPFSCGNGAHIGYNCPPKAPIISNPEPCNQIIDESPQILPSVHPTFNSEDENSFTYDSKPNSVDDSPNVFNPLPQPSLNSCEFCGNDARYGHSCTHQVPFIYPEPCYNQDFNFQQDFHEFQQQYLCCENCGGPHETFQCQPMNEDYYEQNSCYDPNSFGFDQFQTPQYTINHPILNAQNEFLNSQNKLMEQMTSICDMVGQIMQKKEEERRIAEDQAAKDRYWKIPICYDDDEDYTIAITPVLSTKEAVDSLIMEDEHLDTIPATESDEVIKSSVEELVLIPSESEGISDGVCDVPLCDNPTPLKAFKDHSEIVVNSNNDDTSSDDDISLLWIDDDILLTIKDDTLREKLLNVNLLIAKIDALRDNPTPSSDIVIKSTSTFSNLFLEETNTFDNSIPESKTFRFNLEEISSGSPTTRSDLSFSDYKAFYVDNDHFKEKSSDSTTTHVDFSRYDSFIMILSKDQFQPADRSTYHESSPITRSHHVSSDLNVSNLRLNPI
ncbi:hypothetical protein Tco_0582578 [Tanacetum coccineum]